MTRYLVTMVAAVDASIEVEADSEEGARDAAYEEFEAPSLCHQCARAMNPPSDWEATYVEQADAR